MKIASHEDSDGHRERLSRTRFLGLSPNQAMLFTDLDGQVVPVRVLGWEYLSQWSEVKHKAIFDARLLIHDTRTSY